MRLFICFICLFNTIIVIAQSDENQPKEEYEWEDFPASRSNEDFDKFKELYLDESFYWDADQKLVFYEKGYQAATKLLRDSSRHHFSRFLGMTATKIDSFSKALFYLNQSLELAYEPIGKAAAYDMLGTLYDKIGDYEKAISYYLKSLEAAKETDEGFETYPLGNMSDVYENLNDFENAIKYTKTAQTISKTLETPEKEYNLLFDYTDLISLYDKNGKEDSANYYTQLTIDLIEHADTLEHPGIREAIFSSYLTVTEYYLDNNLIEAAGTYLNKVKEYADNYDKDVVSLAEGNYQLAKKNYPAVKQLILFLKKSESTGLKEDVLHLEIDYYNVVGDFKNAFTIQQELTAFQQEKFTTDRLRYSAFASAEYQVLQQQEEIETLRQKRQVDQLTIQNQRYTVIIIAILTVLLLSGAGFLWYRNRQRKQISSYLKEQVALKTQDLEQANYELRTLSFIASHDIKEPIRNISNYVGLIKRKLPKDLQTNLSTYFETIQRGTSQLYTLIEDFMKYTTLSKDDTVELEEVDLQSIMENVSVGLDETLNKTNGQIVYDNLPNLSLSNSSLIYVLLKNLVENGLKYNQSETPTVKIQYQENETSHTIVVEDNGIGIEPEFQDQIFEMFKRLHNRESYEGSGIGLAIVKLVAKKLNATITVNSEVGQGSQFSLVFPK